MNKAIMRLLWVLRKFEITPPREHIQSIIDQYPSLDWSIESIHIYAWINHRQNWNITNWQHKLMQWGKLSSQSGRSNPYASKTPKFDSCRAEIEALDSMDNTPEWVEQNIEDSNFEPETLDEIKEKYGEQSQIYLFMLKNLEFVEYNSIQLKNRMNKLLLWLDWTHNSTEQKDKTYDHLVIAINNKWFENDELIAWIGAHNFILFNLIKVMSKPKKETIHIQPPPPAAEMKDPRPETEEYEVLYSVNCKIEGCRLPMLGRVIAEDSDQILVWLVAPINGEDQYWLQKSLCRIIKDDIEAQPGNITKHQINNAISKMVGDQ